MTYSMTDRLVHRDRSIEELEAGRGEPQELLD